MSDSSVISGDFSDGISLPVTATASAPLLRWAGGKQKLVSTLVRALPAVARDLRYVEPFFGAGSLYFAFKPKDALLSDANRNLIEMYRAVRDSTKEVHEGLSALVNSHSKENYYATRELFNVSGFSTQQAARFIYLNMTCFNGIYRVNARGQFNVPKGSRDRLTLPALETLCALGESLASAVLQSGDYTETLGTVCKHDFVYLDPPYPALSDTAYFKHYTQDRFDEQNEIRLAGVVKSINAVGAKFMMSNADLPIVRELYSGFCVEAIPVKRYVSCKKQRLAVSELIIRNYEGPSIC